MNDTIFPHTAAATWSGFIYQGRIALYHVLKLICEKNANDLKELHIQVDSIEDFAIIKYGQNNEVITVSMHQVKALKTNLYSAYKEAFEKLEQKKKDSGTNDTEAYFHLATKNELAKGKIEETHPSLKIYCYENDLEYCELEIIDEEIKKKIVLSRQKMAITQNNEDSIAILYDKLEKLISDLVLAIHNINHKGIPIAKAAFENTIKLDSFVEIVSVADVSSIIQDEEYFEDKIRFNMNYYYQRFCLENEDESWSDLIKNKMDNYLYLMNTYKGQIFKSFLQNIRPHKEIKYTNLQDYTNANTPEYDFKDAFLYILMTIKESPLLDGWSCNELKHYYPTSINDPNTERSKTLVSERIIQTAMSSKVEVPFNSDYLITSACNVDDIEGRANKIIEAPKENDEENKNITRWKKVSLIDIETVKDKLND